MQQSYSSFATAPAVSRAPAFDVLWDKAVDHGVFLLYLSLLILLFSTIDNGPLGDLMKCCWLISFSALAVINIGSAFVAYIGSLALYSPLHYESMFPLLQRPDNLAMPILFAAMVFQVLSRNRRLRSVDPYMALFIVYFLAHGLIFAPEHSAALIRNIIPFLACLFAAWIGFRQQEIKAFQDGLILLAWYSGFVSILERTPFIDRVLPFWIGDPSLRPFDLYQDQWLDLHRSGGPLLQPAFNGLLIGMVLLIIVLRSRKGITPYHVFATFFCLAGAFFTYTRGVLLSIILALLWFPGWPQSKKQANRRRLIILGGALLVVAAGLAAGGSAVHDRLEDSDNIFYRLQLWGAALRLVALHPVTGVGFFNFGTAMGTVQQGFGSLEREYRTIETGVASHNTALTVVVEFGMPGLVIFILAFWKLVQRARENCFKFLGIPGASWVIAFTIVYVVNSQFISCFEVTVNTIFFGTLGIFAGAREPFA
jgi:O-antigen ligase